MIPLRANSVFLEGLDVTCANFPNWASRTVFVDQCCDMLKSNKSLKQLHIGKMQMDDFDLERLLPGLERNMSLGYLDLHGSVRSPFHLVEAAFMKTVLLKLTRELLRGTSIIRRIFTALVLRLLCHLR